MVYIYLYKSLKNADSPSKICLPSESALASPWNFSRDPRFSLALARPANLGKLDSFFWFDPRNLWTLWSVLLLTCSYENVLRFKISHKVPNNNEQERSQNLTNNLKLKIYKIDVHKLITFTSLKNKGIECKTKPSKTTSKFYFS